MPANSATIELASELIQHASVTPDDGGCQALIADRLEPLGFTTETFDCGKVSNLYARRGTAEPHLTFIGHTDVVPVGSLDAWRFPPFSATQADGFLHGRGAADMKGSVAAMVTACERIFAKGGINSMGSLSLLLTSDEEGEAIDGTRYVLEQLDARGENLQYCLVGEPTSEKTLGDTIKIGRRGSLSGLITVHGIQGHVAYPHLADNPVHRSGALITALAKCDWNDADGVFPDTTLQISNLHAGVGAENVIPGELELNFNIRFSPVQNATALKAQIEKICVDLELDYEIDWSPVTDPYRSAGSHLATIVSSAVFSELGVEPARSTAGGTSDGRFAAASGAEVVEFGPLNATIHQVDECVSIFDLDKLSQVYQRVIERMIGTNPK